MTGWLLQWLRGKAGGVSPSPYSLRRRLLVSVLGASALLWSISLAIMVNIAWDETNDVFDDGLEDAAQLIRAAGADLSGPAVANTGPIDRDRRHAGIYYQLVANNRVLRRTGPSPDEPFVIGFDRHKGFRTVWVGMVPWRIFVLRDEDGGPEVQIGQPLEARTEILEELADDLTWPAMALLALLGAVIWLAISRLIGPIEQTALAIAGKTPEDLTPVAVAEQPVELQPIVNALNTVLGRLDHALQAERRFTADAAHELRTPLSALRMKIQLLERQHPEHRPSLRQLYHDTDRCTALIENLLTLARFDAAQAAALPREPVALPDLLDELRRYHLPQAETGQIGLAIECRVATLVGNADLLRIALRNLLDNALRYCPPGCRVRIDAQYIGNGVRLAVRDDGPGVEASLRNQLAGRFFRVLGNDRSGSGLGLSIVERIAALHGATLHFETGLDQRGLSAVLDFSIAGQEKNAV